jgi:hypothetical protein
MAPGSFACQICSRQKALAKRLELSEKELDAWFESDLFKIHEQELDGDCLSRNQSAKAEGGRNRAAAPIDGHAKSNRKRGSYREKKIFRRSSAQGRLVRHRSLRSLH